MKRLVILIELIAILTLTSIPTNSMLSKYFLMTATGYCPCEICCKGSADGITYTGAKAGRGCIAIDPEAGILKLGQRVFILEYGFGVCNDTGHGIKGWEIDVCSDSHKDAVEWGRQLVKVYVLMEEDK
jgi:3D (Asp-Asp-Asp) domain-containing protein